MRIKVKFKDNTEKIGKFIGITYNDKNVAMAVVRFNGDGMIVRLYHPSEVLPLDAPPPNKSNAPIIVMPTNKREIPSPPVAGDKVATNAAIAHFAPPMEDNDDDGPPLVHNAQVENDFNSGNDMDPVDIKPASDIV